MNRRELLHGMVTAVLMSGSGCATRVVPARPLPRNQSIDAHCHIFNAKDLSGTRFIAYTFLDLAPPPEPEQKQIAASGVRDPDVVDAIVDFVVGLFARNEAPTTDEEIAVLGGAKAARPESREEPLASRHTIDEVQRFLLDTAKRTPAGELTVSAAGTGREKFAALILDAAGGAGNGIQATEAGALRQVAAEAYASNGEIGALFRWLTLFSLYRHALADKLADETRRQGLKPVLLSPAIIDMDKWLGESPASSWRGQMEVMSLIAARKGKVPVHGYFGFDPLREVYHQRLGRREESSLDLTREALTEHGFIGVKLYPPMGFRASNNTGPYPPHIRKELGTSAGLSRDLDAALDELYRLCIGLDAPILAHGHASNGANADYEMRADPAFWSPVFARYRTLRVCLAHFGRFGVRSAGAGARPLPEGSFEWTFGRDVEAMPGQPLFMDASYFSEVLVAAGAERDTLARSFKNWVAEFDPHLEHLVFGTDWLMLARSPAFDRYIPEVNHFLEVDCGIDAAGRDRFFSGNALNFMGLQQNGSTLDRMKRFYADRRLELPAIFAGIA